MPTTSAPTPTQTAVQITSSVTLEGIVTVVFNADKDGMQAAFAQSIIDSTGGLFEEIIDIEAAERQRRRLQTTYSPTLAPTLAPTRGMPTPGVDSVDGVEISYTGVARVDGTDGEAASAALLEQSMDAMTLAVYDGSFLATLQASDPSFAAVTMDVEATQAAIEAASRTFVVMTPRPIAAPTARPTPRPSPDGAIGSAESSSESTSSGGSGGGSDGGVIVAGGGAAAGAILLLAAAAFFFYRRGKGSAANKKPMALSGDVELGDIELEEGNDRSTMLARHIYSCKIEHRDLKTHNVLLTHDGRCKVTDFGLSRCEELKTFTTTATMRDSVAGTPAFMAPELFEDNTFTEKSDVYSYAVVLWEIYDRGIPWAGLKPQQILYKLIKEQRLDVPKSMPRDLSSLMERAWAQDPDARPSFADICKELQATTPRRPSSISRPWSASSPTAGDAPPPASVASGQGSSRSLASSVMNMFRAAQSDEAAAKSDAQPAEEDASSASPAVKRGAEAAKNRINTVFEPMRTWYGAPARAALKKKHGAYPATPEALANWKSFGPVTTAFLDDQGVAPGPTARARGTGNQGADAIEVVWIT